MEGEDCGAGGQGDAGAEVVAAADDEQDRHHEPGLRGGAAVRRLRVVAGRDGGEAGPGDRRGGGAREDREFPGVC